MINFIKEKMWMTVKILPIQVVNNNQCIGLKSQAMNEYVRYANVMIMNGAMKSTPS